MTRTPRIATRLTTSLMMSWNIEDSVLDSKNTNNILEFKFSLEYADDWKEFIKNIDTLPVNH